MHAFRMVPIEKGSEAHKLLMEFDFNNRMRNKDYCNKHADVFQLLHEDDDKKIWISSSLDKGVYIGFDKIYRQAFVIMEFEATKTILVDEAVKLSIWQGCSVKYLNDDSISKFSTYLLDKFPCLMSDKRLTLGGSRYWWKIIRDLDYSIFELQLHDLSTNTILKPENESPELFWNNNYSRTFKLIKENKKYSWVISRRPK